MALRQPPKPQQAAAVGERSATLWLLLAALSFSLMTVAVKQLAGRIPLAEVVMARSLIGVALTAWLLGRAGQAPWGQRRGLLVARGLIGSGALLCVFGALAHLPLATATVLQYLYPSVTALLAWPWLGERPGPRAIAGLGLGWLGVLMVCFPALPGGTSAPGLSALGVLLAIVGAVLTALAYVSVRELGRSEHPLVIVLYFPMVAVPLCLPLVLADPVLPTPEETLWLLAVGVFTQVGQLGITRGLTGLPAARATTISYVQVLFAGLWGWWWFAEWPSGSTVAGAILILVATLICA
ncbi:MAG: DMT family transporter [Cyanobacteriota bacterium]|nr:DMT family transporter [Cyanobacteriota bacterium]